MALRYPFLIIVIIGSIIIYFFLTKKKQKKYNDGSKIANTKYIKNTEYFRTKIKKYQLAKKVLLVFFAISIICSSILICRLAKIQNIDNTIYNRDIFLCMDISASVDELNMDVSENLKEIVNNLHGERFGVSIFNTTSVLLSPLTDDYNYISDVLNTIIKAIKASDPFNYGQYTGDDYNYLLKYIREGTRDGADLKGSSLIGDGLASCVAGFSNIDENRTKIIIFSTDNDFQGAEGIDYYTLDSAAALAQKKNIIVFGIATENIFGTDETEFRNAMLNHGGKYYDNIKTIINDIEKTSKSLLKNQYQVKKVDIPTVPFLFLMISISGIIVITRKVIK